MRYRVCDRCGTLHLVTQRSGADFSCDACGATAAWEFTKRSAAFDMQGQVREARGITAEHGGGVITVRSA